MGVFIHPSAVVEKEVELDEDVYIGPFCYVEGKVKIGRGTKLHYHVHIRGPAEIGEENEFYACNIGEIPQDFRFNNPSPMVKIGNRNIFREYVTLHQSSVEGHATLIGDDNFFMNYTHIAHDVEIGNHVVTVTCVGLAGHCIVEDYAYIGPYSGFHQFVRIGKGAFLGAYTRVPQDIPPYAFVQGIPAKVYGINVVGLKRRGMPPKKRLLLKRAYKILYFSGYSISHAIEEIKKEILEKEPQEDTKPVEELVRFIQTSKRGILFTPAGKEEEDGKRTL